MAPGTVYNDEMESKAIHLAGLQGCYVNSLKPYLGHTLGAAGVAEKVLCLEQLNENTMWGTPGFQKLGVPLPLNVFAKDEKKTLHRILKLLSGFGGTNAALILAKEDATKKTMQKQVEKTVSPIVVESSHFRICQQNANAGENFAQRIRREYKALSNVNPRFYKMDNLGKLGSVAADNLLSNAYLSEKYLPQEVGIDYRSKF